ncbi:hypothetical protein V2G26_010744 [Clonostachys chloroleuca]
MWQDVCRWQHEGGKPATVERTCEEMHIILGQIHGLKEDHNARCQPLSLRRNTEPVSSYTGTTVLIFSLLIIILVAANVIAFKRRRTSFRLQSRHLDLDRRE